MDQFLLQHYEWLRALHIIAVIAWMAGMLYLPRLFVYHADKAPGSPEAEMLKSMEVRLLRIILNPAMIISWLLGLSMLYANPGMLSDGGWMHLKLTLVVLMSGLHGFLAKCRKEFERGENKRSAKFYRFLNEAPTLLMIVVVIMAVVQPF
jgi:putative membrane protein